MLFPKSLIAPLFLPLPLCFLLAGIGLALVWFSRWQRAGRLLATSGFAILLMLSYGVSRPALQALEQGYKPPEEADLAGAKWVVVLGGGTTSDPSVPLTSRIGAATLYRLVDGIRLQRQIPGSRLLLSGAAVFNSGSDAQAMSALAISLGVQAADIVLDDESPDTETQAVNIARIVKHERCVLVTSAFHMPRAMKLFLKAGLTPLPAPAQYAAQSSPGVRPADFYPGLRGLIWAQLAANEYLGIAWSTLRGRI